MNIVQQSLLVYQSNIDGHHLPYLDRVLRAVVSQGKRVLVGTSADFGAAVETQVAVSAPSTRVITAIKNNWISSAGLFGYLCNQLSGYAHLWRLSKSVQATSGSHRTFVTHLVDIYLPCALLRGKGIGTAFTGILMNANFHHAEMRVDNEPSSFRRLVSDRIKAGLFMRLIRSPRCKTLLVLDPTLAEWAHKHDPEAARKVKFLPDPATPIGHKLPHLARSHFGIDRSDLCIVLVFGALDARRKNISILLEAASSRPNIGILLVGRFHVNLRQLMSTERVSQLTKEKRLFIRNAFVTTEEEDLAYAAADCVWLNYSEHRNMSGVLVKTARSRRIAILSRHGLLGWYGRSRGIGVVVEGDDIHSVLRVLDQVQAGDTTVIASLDRAEQEFASFGEEKFASEVLASVT